ncbi:MAG: 2-oxoglutarate dehydrogenase complex dihydrolipoyllysine-residue succinyltransferase [Planctomycetota bacterium]|nr:2-oxoglutarate dehydrogenase complex dihydrolipoyllysine-residue succinyltransferase [Planctomycetota bacterium]
MPVDITIPSPGESITDVSVGAWLKSSGEWVEKDEPLVEIESDKAALEVPAPESGVLTITAEQGEEMNVGDVIGTIDPEPPEGRPEERAETEEKPPPRGRSEQPAKKTDEIATRVEVATATASGAGDGGENASGGRVTPLARKIAAEKGVDLDTVRGTGPSGRITKSDVIAAAPGSGTAAAAGGAPHDGDESTLPAVSEQTVSAPEDGGAADLPVSMRGTRREKLSRLRLRLAERLVAAQRTAAMLTTFNEADMSEVIRLRKRHKDTFLEKHGVGLGFMSFFVKAAVSALKQFPGVNSYIIDNEIEYHDYQDISIAVGTPRGLVVPVLRNAELMSFAAIEAKIKDLASRAQNGRLSIEEMTGGTFTISNGGIYGSLMSTPILNPPQSGILGMHKIMKRAVEDPNNPGELVLRPMMYLALSYDHRVVDGEQAVRFLVHIKECIENPERMLLEV